MAGTIEITTGDIRLRADLYENETAKEIRRALPIEGRAARWGEEIYFSIPEGWNWPPMHATTCRWVS